MGRNGPARDPRSPYVMPRGGLGLSPVSLRKSLSTGPGTAVQITAGIIVCQLLGAFNKEIAPQHMNQDRDQDVMRYRTAAAASMLAVTLKYSAVFHHRSVNDIAVVCRGQRKTARGLAAGRYSTTLPSARTPHIAPLRVSRSQRFTSAQIWALAHALGRFSSSAASRGFAPSLRPLHKEIVGTALS
jgi:hypothetical protein